MRKKQRIKWKKGLAVVLAATVTATSTVSGNGKSVLLVHAAGEENEDATTEGIDTRTTKDTSVENKELPEATQPVPCGEGENGPKYTFIDGVLTFSGTGIVTTTDFKGCTNIIKVTAEDDCSITELPKNCFEGCSEIEEVELSKLSGLMELPYRCFTGCKSLTTISIPNNIHVLGQYCFSECENLGSISVPEKIEIGARCFENCKLLRDVYYEGSKASWENIEAVKGYPELNKSLIDAQKHYGKCTITFDYSTNGGKRIIGENSIEVNANSTDISINIEDNTIPKAEKTGWEFVGWNTNNNAEEALPTVSVKENDIVLYAIFKKDLTVTFVDSKEGNHSISSKSLSIYNKQTETIMTMPELTEKQDWIAVGWAETENDINPNLKQGNEVSISKNTTYYAVYKQNVNINYNAGVIPDTENNMLNVALPGNSTKVRHCIGGEILNPTFILAAGLNKSGYSFDGWKNEIGMKYEAGASITVDENKVQETFTASWTTEKAIAPTIRTQPKDVRSIYGYENESMQVDAVADTGTKYTLSYQWYEKKDASTSESKLIEGATTSKLNIPKGNNAGIYYYYCEIKATRIDNEKESISVISESAAFTVEKAEREITIGNLNKIFDQEPVDVTSKVEVKNKTDKTIVTEQVDLEYNYYEDSNGKLGNPLSPQSAPSEPGTYWVEVKTKEATGSNYKETSAKEQFIISYLQTPEKPYILKVNGIEVEGKEWYNQDVTILPPSEDYKIVRDSYKNNFGSEILVSGLQEGKHTIHFYLQDKLGKITNKISIPVNVDKTNPKGAIQIQEKDNSKDLSAALSEQYFKEAQSINIYGTDEEGSGVDTISYFCSSEEYTSIDNINPTQWKKYNGTFSLSPTANYIVYVKITDKAGNNCYLKSDKLVFESTKPSIIGVTNGGSYYGEHIFEVQDQFGLKSIQLGSVDLMEELKNDGDVCKILNENGQEKCSVQRITDNKYKISPTVNNGSYSIRAEDLAGNVEIINAFTLYKKFTVTYEDGEGKEIEKQQVNYNEKAVLPKELPKKTGYSLTGWCEKGTEKDFNLNIPITEKDITLIPKWEKDSYQVQFDSRGGSACSNQMVKYDEAFGIMQEPSRSGYEFGGWYTSVPITEQEKESEQYTNDSSKSSEKVGKGTIVKSVKDIITLYAFWIPKQYTVTLIGQGGTIIVPSTGTESESNPKEYNRTITYNETYGELPKASKPGYDFAGWYTDRTSGNKISDTTVYDYAGNTTLYAQWTAADFTVNLKYYDEHQESTIEPETITVTYNSTYEKLPKTIPIRTGYTFKGWYDEETGGEQITKDTKVEITNNTTLYAQWTANEYKITFDAKGGSACEETTVVYNETYGELPMPTRTGYSFKGWYNKEIGGEQITKDTKVEITNDTTLYAQWTANEYKITFDAKGGSACEEIRVVYNDKYGKLPMPTRTGYSFKGWFLPTETGEIEIKEDTTVDILGDITLYAQWTANEYKITFDAKGGSACSDKKVVYDKTYDELPEPTKLGYIFEGWYDKEIDGEQITKDTKVEITNNITLYAQWTANKYKIIFDKNTGNDVKLPVNTSNEKYDSTNNTLEVTYDEPYGTLPEATKTGYTFDGWYTEAVNGTRFNGTGNVSITGDMTLYAHWTANSLSFDSEFKTKLKDAIYRKEYNEEIGKPINGTGEYEYTLMQGSSLPIGLELVENRIEGSLLENVREEPFTFKIKITDKDSKQSVEQEFQICSQKAEQKAPEAPQVITKTSNSVTLKNISNIQYCVVEAKENEAEPSEEHLEWKNDLIFDKLEAGKTYNFYARWKEQTNYKASPKSENISVTTLHVYNIEIPVVSASENHYKIVSVPESSKGLIKNTDDNTKEQGDSIVQIEQGGSYAFKIEFDQGYNKTSDFVVYADGDSKQEVITPSSNGLYIIKDIIGNKKIAVEGVGDVSAPTGKITIEESTWSSFGRDVSFQRFYNIQNVPSITIQGEDQEEGIKCISYYIGSGDDIKTETQIRDSNIVWKESLSATGNKTEQISVDKAELEKKGEGKWVIYANITDTNNNSTYLRSDGIVIDNTAPSITAVSGEGTNKDGVYVYETMENSIPFIIQDEYLKDVTIDGNPFYSFEGKYSVPADDTNHTMIAKDQAGNETTLQVKVCMKTYTVSFHVTGDSGDTVTEVSASYNQPVQKPSDPTKAGSIFYGWFLNGQEFDFNTRITEDITLEAKWLEAGSSTVSKPQEVSKTQTRVTLKQENGYQYRINGEQPVDNPVFTGLTPGKTYYFYKIDKEGNVSEPLAITTEGVSGATGMMALPSTLYQGDVYDIEPTVAMEGLINKSADPASTEIIWFVNKPDIVSITNPSTKGCSISINQVPYQKNRLTRVTLTVTVVYTQLNQGNLVTKKKSYKKSFHVQNLCNEVSVDLSQLSTQPASTGAFVSGSAICLMDKKGISLKTIINRGAEDDIATNQKLKWFISDENGKINGKGRKIASVNSKGVLKGIRPGKTYVTVATADSYKKSEKSYSVYRTYEVICPWVTAVSFDNTVENVAKAGSTLDLSSVLQCNPENVFNKEKMAKRWRSSDTKVARVTSKGKVIFRKAGTVTITCTPTGGQEISAVTGKVSDTAKNIITEITFTVQ